MLYSLFSILLPYTIFPSSFSSTHPTDNGWVLSYERGSAQGFFQIKANLLVCCTFAHVIFKTHVATLATDPPAVLTSERSLELQLVRTEPWLTMICFAQDRQKVSQTWNQLNQFNSSLLSLPAVTAEIHDYWTFPGKIHGNLSHSHYLLFVGGVVGDRYLWRVCGPHGRALQRIPGYRWDFLYSYLYLLSCIIYR